MAEAPDRRALIDPRYVTWEAFDRRANEVDARLNRDTDDEAMYRDRVGRELAEQQSEITKLRVQLGRAQVYLSIAMGAVGLVGGPVITFFLLRH